MMQSYLKVKSAIFRHFVLLTGLGDLKDRLIYAQIVGENALIRVQGSFLLRVIASSKGIT